MIEQGILREVEYTKSLYLSPIFLVEKSSGGKRMILNLKKFNESVLYRHFKMESFEHALSLVTPNVYMASLDIKHAYYSVAVDKNHQKYLSFEFQGKYYVYTCIPNGLASGPYLFTRIMKPALGTLRKEGHLNTCYIDDSLLFGKTKETCKSNVIRSEELLVFLGFVINNSKSVKNPTQQIKHLGNVIDSVEMIVTLPEGRVKSILEQCHNILKAKIMPIRQVARLIGLLVASFSAVEFGKLHYRRIERRKIAALKSAKGNFNKNMHIDAYIRADLLWWVKHIKSQFRVIQRPQAEVTITTDSSLLGWGCVVNDLTINGKWTANEAALHINALEILAIFFSLKSLVHIMEGKTVLILTDSTTAVAYVNNMGGVKSLACDKIARSIWDTCIKHDIWITCSHIPGVDNEADEASRSFYDRHDWSLCSSVFNQLTMLWNLPDIDLFANRLNAKVKWFCSWKPDPDAIHVDAFTICWSNYSLIYAFPPFSLLTKVLQKIRAEEVECIIVAPLWPTQVWFPMMMGMAVDAPRVLPPVESILKKPQEETTHPLAARMVLIGVRVSGKITKVKDFQKGLPKYSHRPGGSQLPSNINRIYKDGYFTVSNDRLIQFVLL